MSALLLNFQQVLMLSEREDFLALEKKILRQLGLVGIQHRSQASGILEIHASSQRFKKIDLIICTERLEDMHALSFIEALRAEPKLSNTPLLVFPDSTRCWREAEKLGACCLLRPYTVRDFQNAIHKASHLAGHLFRVPRKAKIDKHPAFKQSAFQYKTLHKAAHAQSVEKSSLVSQHERSEVSAAESLLSESAEPNITALLRRAPEEYEEAAGLGLSRPEPPKRAPFSLVDDEQDYLPLSNRFKREPFPLVEDDMQWVPLRRQSFPLVEDNKLPTLGEQPMSQALLQRLQRVELSQSQPLEQPRAAQAPPDQNPPRQSEPALLSMAAMQDYTQHITQNYEGDEQPATLEQAELMLLRGFHMNAANMFFKLSEKERNGCSIVRLIVTSCQYTGAPADNLRAMCKAAAVLGYKQSAERLEQCRLKMYGSEESSSSKKQKMRGLPLLGEILGVARLTLAAWSGPYDALEA